MFSILSYVFARFFDVLLLASIIYGLQKYSGDGMTMNIEDEGNLIFVLSLSFTCFFAGFSQAKMEK